MLICFLRVTLFSTFFCVLTACTSAYVSSVTQETLETTRLKSAYRVIRNSDWVVHSKTPIFLAQSEDLFEQYRSRNRQALYESLDHSLRQAFPSFATDSQSLPLSEAFVMAEAQGSELLFWPQLVVSDDALNTRREIIEGRGIHPEKSYGPDRAVFKVLIYEVRTKTLLDMATVLGRGRMLASNGAMPQDLFHGASVFYIHSITGKRAS